MPQEGVENEALNATDEAQEIEMLQMQKGETHRQESVPLLFTAINDGNYEGVKNILDQTTEHINSNSYGGLTPLHAACHMRQMDILNLLISRGAKVEALDSLGSSATHVAVREDWYDGVKALLDHGASPRLMSDPPSNIANQFKETPVHSAVRTGNIAIITLILKYNPDLSLRDRNNQTVFHLAAAMRNAQALKELLRNPEKSQLLETMAEKTESLYHAALPSTANVEHEDQILKVIQLLYKCVSDDLSIVNFRGETPLHCACRLGLPNVVKFFLTNGADPTQVTRDYETVVHAACAAGCSKTLQHLLNSGKINDKVLAKDSNGNQPFHLALESASLECCKMLLHNGEHLANVDTNGKTNCSLVLERLPSAMQLFQDIFDSGVKLSKKSQYDPDFNITFDYSILCSERDEMQSSIACELAGTRLEPLIKHPLLESFLCIKWSRIRNVFYFNVIQYFLYVMLHTVFVLLTYGKRQLDWSQYHDWYMAFKSFHIILIISISVPAIIMTMANFKKLMRQWETYTRIIAMVTSAYVVFITTERSVNKNTRPTPKDTGSTVLNSTSMDTGSTVSVETALASTALLFVWVELMMLLGRFPALGTYILMFTKISKSVIKFLLAFLSLIFGFSMSFYILFQNNPVFNNYALSFAKTIMMMTGEIAYSEFVLLSKEPLDSPKHMTFDIFCLVIMTLFVFLVTIIMSNLLIGLAVEDIPHLKKLGKIKRLVKQASYLVAYEKVLALAYKARFFPSGLRELLSSRSSTKSIVTISPNKKGKKDEYHYDIKRETINEAILLRNITTSDDFQPPHEIYDDVGKQLKSFQVKYANDRRSHKSKFDEICTMCGDVKTTMEQQIELSKRILEQLQSQSAIETHED